MTRRFYSNTATQVTLASGITSGATSATINETFAGWPATPFDAVLEYGTANAEAISVSAVSGKTVTIARGQDGTSAVSHNAGATMDHAVIAKDLDEANAHVNATSGVHGITGNVVGDTDAQTLTNKTLNGATLTGTFQASTPVLTSNGAQTLTVKNTGTATSDVALKVVPANAGVSTTYAIETRDSNDASTVFSVDNGGGVNGTFFQASNGIILPVWATYTPVLTATTTNPTGWTSSGFYQSLGSTILFEITLQAGAGFTAGSGDYVVTLPPFAGATNQVPLGNCVVTGNNYTFIPTMLTSSTIKLAETGSSTGYLGDGGPYGHAWAQSNTIRISGLYRVN